MGALVVLALCAWLPRGAFGAGSDAAASGTVVTSATVPGATLASVAVKAR